MNQSIRFKIKLLSNLFIGGASTPFEIGGIDQFTVTTSDGQPYIPASTMKGALRNIIREDDSAEGKQVKEIYQAYFEEEKKKAYAEIENRGGEYQEILAKLKQKYEKEITAESLFGREGFNIAPKLLFSDLKLALEFQDRNKYFSIDTKTSIVENREELRIESNPRTYKTAREGLLFEGEIVFYKMDKLGSHAIELCKKYISSNLNKFNEGYYRLGNSKSRGYGKIMIEIIEESEEETK